MVVDETDAIIRFKRSSAAMVSTSENDLVVIDEKEHDDERDKKEHDEHDGDYDDAHSETIKQVIAICKESGRGDDFLATLKGLADHTVPIENIAVQTFLDIGKLVKAEKSIASSVFMCF